MTNAARNSRKSREFRKRPSLNNRRTGYEGDAPVPDSRWKKMTLDEAIGVAHRETGISYQKDDPVLSVVAILNAFGDRLDAMLEEERTRVSDQFHNDISGMNAVIDRKVDEVAGTIHKLAANLGQDSIQMVVSAIAQHAVDSDKVTRTIRQAFYGFSALAFVNWAAVGAFYLIIK